MAFQKIKETEIQENFVKLLNENWGLLTAGTAEKLDTMTISSGAIGNMFRMNVVYVYVRPSRYTKTFIEKEDYFTVSFFDEAYKPQLTLCGRKSGRDTDKAAECGFTTAFADCGAPYFEEASLVLVCRKIYKEEIRPESFIDGSIKDWYPREDYHTAYVGEIVEVLKK